VRIKAIHDVDLVDALKRLGVYEGVRVALIPVLFVGGGLRLTTSVPLLSWTR